MVKLDSNKLISLVTKIFVANGLLEDDAAIIANTLVTANLTGRGSHGVLLTKVYLDRIKKGGANKTPNFNILSESDTTALVDGDDGLGMIVAHKAAKLAREKAEKAGVACVVVKRSNHYGAAAVWTDMMAQDDMIGFSCCNTAPLTVPPGAKTTVLGTNPLCISVPTASYGNVCLDIATSMVAQGRLFDYRHKGLTLPDGWAVDSEGLPTNDPQKATYLVPFAAHKGYGIAVMIEIMSALLAGGEFGKYVNDQYHDSDKPNLISEFFMALKISQFRDCEQFKKDMDSFIEYLHSVPTLEGQKVYFPGEIEQINRKKAEEEGLQLPESLIEELKGFAKEAGIENAEEYLCL